jgi:uncharacterized RDD family membrane protein YckC
MRDSDLIETPENVELEQRLAGIGSRFVAGMLDNLIIVALIALLIVVIMLVAWVNPLDLIHTVKESGQWALALLILAAYGVYWGYFVFCEMITNGQSPGKRSQRLRVVKEGGGAIGFTDIAVRNLLRAVDSLPFGYALAGVCMFFSEKVQRLGDMAAGTVVVSEQLPDYSARADKPMKMEWERETDSSSLRATGLTPNEFRALFNYWARRGELTPAARRRVLPQLLRPILQRTGEHLPGEDLSSMEAYVESLLQKAATAEQRSQSPTP